MNQSQVYLCTFPLEPPTHHLPPHPTLPGCHRALGWAPCVHRQFPVAICFRYGNVYVSMPPSQFIPPSPSRTVSTSLFSMSVPPLLPCEKFSNLHTTPWLTQPDIPEHSQLPLGVLKAFGSHLDLVLFPPELDNWFTYPLPSLDSELPKDRELLLSIQVSHDLMPDRPLTSTHCMNERTDKCINEWMLKRPYSKTISSMSRKFLGK